MTALNRNPQNTNLLQPTKFLLTFDRLESVPYFCQTVNIPSISLGEVTRPTPFLDLYSPGTKLIYDPFDVTFLVDEELASWKNMYDWFISIAKNEARSFLIKSQKIKFAENAEEIFKTYPLKWTEPTEEKEEIYTLIKVLSFLLKVFYYPNGSYQT